MKKNSTAPRRLPSGNARTTRPQDWRIIGDEIQAAMIAIATTRDFRVDLEGCAPRIFCTVGQFRALEKAARELMAQPSAEKAPAVITQSEPVDHLTPPPPYHPEETDTPGMSSDELVNEVTIEDWVRAADAEEADRAFFRLCVDADRAELEALDDDIERMEAQETDAKNCGYCCDWSHEIEEARDRIAEISARLVGIDFRGLFGRQRCTEL